MNPKEFNKASKIMSDILEDSKAESGSSATTCSAQFDNFVKVDWNKIWAGIPEQRTQLECDDKGGILSLCLARDGDVHLAVFPHAKADQLGHFGSPGVRVRTIAGGGRNSRTREALLLLMLAIAEDEKYPERDWENL